MRHVEAFDTSLYVTLRIYIYIYMINTSLTRFLCLSISDLHSHLVVAVFTHLNKTRGILRHCGSFRLPQKGAVKGVKGAGL